MVTTETPTGELQEITDKREMERAIMKNNEQKFSNLTTPPSSANLFLGSLDLKVSPKHQPPFWPASMSQIRNFLLG
jgi:hypothetical protein